MTYAGEYWGRDIRARPGPMLLPFIVPVLLVQCPARNTPTRLSQILDVPPNLRSRVGAPFAVDLYVDDFSGSVLDDPVAPLGFRALVELARAFLHAYKNPGSLTDERIEELAPLFDIVLDYFGPDDIQALWT